MNAEQEARDILQRLGVTRPFYYSAGDLMELANLIAEKKELERTVQSIAKMLGWDNVPPRDTLERSIAALKVRADIPLRDTR